MSHVKQPQRIPIDIFTVIDYNLSCSAAFCGVADKPDFNGVHNIMKKALCLILALILSLTILTSCNSKKENAKYGVMKSGTLTIGSEIGYPPFELYGDDGKTPIGLDMELADEIAKILGLKVEIVDTGFDGILGGINAKKYDIVMSALTITAERAEEVNFSNPYIENWQSIVILKGTSAITSPSELAGFNVVYQIGTTSEIYIENLIEQGILPSDLNHNAYEKVTNAFDELNTGRADAVVCDSVVADGYVAKNPDLYEISWIQSSEADAEPELFGIAVSKDNTELLNAINDALSQLEKNGRLTEIRSSWLS